MKVILVTSLEKGTKAYKEVVMHVFCRLWCALVLLVPALGLVQGCAQQRVDTAEADRVLLSVDFQSMQTLRYKFVSNRDIELEWNPGVQTNAQQNRVDNYFERMEMVMEYQPVDVDPFGLTEIQATCRSLSVQRSKARARSAAKDAVEHLPGKTFSIKVAPSGRIDDYSDLERLIGETGSKAFRPRGPGRGRIKEPDMIGDFWASQWFLWDAVSSVPDPGRGVAVGDVWISKLYVPAPMVIRKAMEVTYSLEELRPADDGQVAVISSLYGPSEAVTAGWPVPYTGRFQMSGTFGFLRNYRLLELAGDGRELFNISLGRTESYDHSYVMKLIASLPGDMGIEPVITIRQKLTMELLEQQD